MFLQLEELLSARSVDAAAHKEEASEWEWCKKRLVGSSKGTKTNNNVHGYNPWWGIFMDTVQLGKRAALDDIRTIHKACPQQPKSRDEPAGTQKKVKKWLQVRGTRRNALLPLSPPPTLPTAMAEEMLLRMPFGGTEADVFFLRRLRLENLQRSSGTGSGGRPR